MEVLIVQRIGDRAYVYTETLKHHARVQENGCSDRPTDKRVPFSTFDNECEVLLALRDGEWTSAFVTTED